MLTFLKFEKNCHPELDSWFVNKKIDITDSETSSEWHILFKKLKFEIASALAVFAILMVGMKDIM